MLVLCCCFVLCAFNVYFAPEPVKVFILCNCQWCSYACYLLHFFTVYNFFRVPHTHTHSYSNRHPSSLSERNETFFVYHLIFPHITKCAFDNVNDVCFLGCLRNLYTRVYTIIIWTLSPTHKWVFIRWSSWDGKAATVARESERNLFKLRYGNEKHGEDICVF